MCMCIFSAVKANQFVKCENMNSCAFGCINRRSKENQHVSFYHLPSTKTKEKAERRS